MTKQERDDMILEARVFYQAAPLIMPIIEKRKRYALDLLMNAYRAGRADLIALVAEVAAFDSIEREIRQKEKTYDILEEEK